MHILFENNFKKPGAFPQPAICGHAPGFKKNFSVGVRESTNHIINKDES